MAKLIQSLSLGTFGLAWLFRLGGALRENGYEGWEGRCGKMGMKGRVKLWLVGFVLKSG